MKKNQPKEINQSNKLKLSNWVYLGIGVFSLLLGFLIGNSNSPVIGATLTAIFGLLSAFLSIYKGKEISHLQKSGRIVGLFLIIFSLFFIVGDLIGIGLRIGYFKEQKEYPWKNFSTPNTTKNALEWIVLQEELLNKGYSNKQIQKLYRVFYTKPVYNSPNSDDLNTTTDSISSFLIPELFDFGSPKKWQHEIGKEN